MAHDFSNIRENSEAVVTPGSLVLGQLGTGHDYENLSQKLPWRKQSFSSAWEGLRPHLTAPQDSLA